MGLFSKESAGFLKWESIRSYGSLIPATVVRSKVHGGWLVATLATRDNISGVTFVPDPNHEWQLDQTKE